MRNRKIEPDDPRGTGAPQGGGEQNELRRHRICLAGATALWLLISSAAAGLPVDHEAGMDEARRKIDAVLRLEPGRDPVVPGAWTGIVDGARFALARHELLRRLGPEGLAALRTKPIHAAFAESLWEDRYRLEKLLANATARDRIAPVITIWADLYASESARLRAKYDNLMLAVALHFDAEPGRAVAGDHRIDEQGAILVRTQVDKDNPKKIETALLTPASRYAWYRDRWEAGDMLTDPTAFSPWELKYAVNTFRPDEDLDWAQTGLHAKLEEFFAKPGGEIRRGFISVLYAVPYIWPWGGNMSRHLEEMTANGAVCGGQSDFFQACAQAHGIPAAKQAGPGHGWPAWKASEEKGWVLSGNGWYNPANSTYRDDWYEDGSHSQARATLFHLPDLHGGDLCATEAWMSAARAARETEGRGALEKRLLLGAVLRGGRNPYAFLRATARFGELGDGVAPGEWTALARAAEAAYLPQHADMFHDLLGRIWRLEEKRALDPVSPRIALKRLAALRRALLDTVPDRGDLLLDVVRREMRFMTAGTRPKTIAAHLDSLLDDTEQQGALVALGRARLELEAGDPLRAEKVARGLLEKLAAVPVTSLGERIACTRELSGYLDFSAARRIGSWSSRDLDGGAAATVLFDLTALARMIHGPATLKVMFVPTEGPHVLVVDRAAVVRGDRVLAEHRKAIEVREGARPAAIPFELPADEKRVNVKLRLEWRAPGGNGFAGRIVARIDPRPDFAKSGRVGGWGKELFDLADPARPWQVVQVADLTGHLFGPGPIFLEARYSSYEKGVFAWMKLYENGREIDADLHAGDSRGDPSARRWRFDLKRHDPKASYTVQALMAPCNGWGQLMICPRE